MVYKILADAVVMVHFFWILFLIFGAVPGVRWKAVKIIHVSGLAFAVVIQAFGWYCPLTDLEVWLRSKQNPSATYTGSFIVHYAEKLVYIELPPTVILAGTVLVVCFSAWMYLRSRRTAR
ncbi:MAG: DUF2784 domain-containing protein [Candidatus Sulfobium sp.]|jgi:hypothetical protein